MADVMKNDPSVIKIRGMPYEATAMEVCRFFHDCDIVGGPNGIYFCLNDKGLPTGEAFIEMETQSDIDKALEKHKELMGKRYIEVFESRLSVMDKVKRGVERDRSPRERFGRGGGRERFGRDGSRDRDVDGLRRDRKRGFGRERGFGVSSSYGGGKGDVSEYCVKLRGLPWEATKDDIVDFLHRCNIEGGSRGVFINTDDRGRASGDAYVELESAEDLENALKMHKRDLGSRYIEVFEANTIDVGRAKDMMGRGRGGGSNSYARERSKGYTVQLRGLPFRVNEREIADWLSEAGDPTDVIITMDKTGRPSGQADAIFSSSREARRVVEEMHKRDLGHRYIECFYEGDE